MHGELNLPKTRRKIGPRYPGGKLKPAPHNETPDSRWRRIKDHAIALGAHPDIGSVLGRLSLAGIITNKEAAAGIWVAETYGRFERLNGLPRRAAASPAYERSYGRGVDGGTVWDAEERVDKARKAMKRIDRVLIREANAAMESLARSILEDVCCNDREINSAHHGALAAILRAIALDRGF